MPAVNNEQYFSESFLERMEDILITEKNKIEEKLSMHKKHIEESEETGDTNKEDKIGDLQDKALDESLEGNLEKKLEDIEAAIERLEKGTYGICKYTDKPINKKRLLARPTSTSSVEAKKFLTDEN